MLFEATVRISLPGNNEEDAIARLKRNVPHWPFEVVEIKPAPMQPPKLVGKGEIQLPLMGVTNGR